MADEPTEKGAIRFAERISSLLSPVAVNFIWMEARRATGLQSCQDVLDRRPVDVTVGIGGVRAQAPRTISTEQGACRSRLSDRLPRQSRSLLVKPRAPITKSSSRLASTYLTDGIDDVVHLHLRHDRKTLLDKVIPQPVDERSGSFHNRLGQFGQLQFG